MLSRDELIDVMLNSENILYNKYTREYIRFDDEKCFIKYDADWRPISIIIEQELYDLYCNDNWVVDMYDVVKPMSFEQFRDKMRTRHIHYQFYPYRYVDDEAVLYVYSNHDKVWVISGFTLMSLYTRYTTCSTGFNFSWTIPESTWTAPVDPKSKRYIK